MNEKSCAPTCKVEDWASIDWNKARAYVKKLQMRIVKTQQEGHYSKVKTLQWLLTHSFYAKALAVKRVTSNRGKNTAALLPSGGAGLRPRQRAMGKAVHPAGATTHPAQALCRQIQGTGTSAPDTETAKLSAAGVLGAAPQRFGKIPAWQQQEIPHRFHCAAQHGMMREPRDKAAM